MPLTVERGGLVVYYESIKRELKTKLIYECRCDERLKTKVEESTRLACTMLHGGSPLFYFLNLFFNHKVISETKAGHLCFE